MFQYLKNKKKIKLEHLLYLADKAIKDINHRCLIIFFKLPMHSEIIKMYEKFFFQNLNLKT